jgi:hypothetical protein
MNEQNQHHTETDSIVFTIPESREYSPETDVDPSIKLGSGAVRILVEQDSSRNALIDVHNPSNKTDQQIRNIAGR